MLKTVNDMPILIQAGSDAFASVNSEDKKIYFADWAVELMMDVRYSGLAGAEELGVDALLAAYVAHEIGDHTAAGKSDGNSHFGDGAFGNAAA